ncbi:MAG: polysaccharide lyase [Verrucomicrobiota bacterium]|nr:polysaccharide lyase [Verrucomicrobiota bacterium]
MEKRVVLLHRTSIAKAAAVLGWVLIGVCASPARESWPVPAGADLRRQQEFKQHQQEVRRRIQPEMQEWAKRGKPFIPWAAKPEDLPQAKVPAFPGAEGGGAFSFGGRGGKIYVVTNLNDNGPGSFRQACEAAGPRIVVFNVAGIIHLKMPIYIEAPYITIAGQTAPGDGICIADQGIVDDAHDVVIRYVRFRRGNTDIFNRHGCHYGNPVGNIIIDHCSASWGEDQNLDTYRHMYKPAMGGPALKLPSVNVTIQWCISSEALNTYNHAFGGDWGGRNTLFDHNLFACNTGRNPSIAMTYDFNFVNNVLFNWRHRSVDGGDKNSRINVINNYYKPGPATLDNPVRWRILEPAQSWSKSHPVSRWGKAYVAGNIVEGYPKVTADNWDGGVQFNVAPNELPDGAIAKGMIDNAARLRQIIAQVRVDKPFPMPPVRIQSAQVAYESVLAKAGDTLPRRDAVDQRIIQEVRTGKVWSEGREFTPPHRKGLPKNDIGIAGNGIITDISQVGGYPEYEGEAAKDLRTDGIPLWWKIKYHLNTNDVALASEDLKGDGYTVMDKYLDGLDPNRKIDWGDPHSNVNTLTAADFQAPAK